MQEQTLSEVQARAADQAGERDVVRKLEAHAHTTAVLEEMRAEGKVITMTEEEIQVLEAFRRFKARVRKNGEVFRWQTSKPEGVQLASDTSLITHPNEV